MSEASRIGGVAVTVLGLAALVAGAAEPLAPPTGLWRAKRHFGPDVKGPLAIQQSGDAWSAAIAGRTATVRQDGGGISFELADGEGAFRGRRSADRIIGHWIQPRTVWSGMAYATPVVLEKQRAGRWRGTVTPLDDEMTFYLSVEVKGAGPPAAFLRNPERNAGRFLDVQHLVLEGGKLRLTGRPSKEGVETTVAEGVYDAEEQSLSVVLPSRGGTFDFRRATAADEAAFFPRGRSPAPYAYRRPPEEDDGWPVASPEDVGISSEAIGRFVQMLIDTPIDSVHASDVHAVLIARHGKLVLEEYFHGFHRDALHDTRSAAKSLTSVLTGAATRHGEPVAASGSVYLAMEGPAALSGLDPRKRAMTTENLLTMSSGLDCDDSDPDSPGNEDNMQEQTAQPDWYRYTLDLKMVRAPGEKAVYCSCNPNLLGGVLARTTGRWLPDLFQELVAEPLGIRRYALNLTPTGEAYMGGGAQFLPRDFLKLGQLLLDGGSWRGRQVVSADWARRSASPLYELGGLHYGYLWWVVDYPWKDGTVRAFFAGGNGGQVVMGIPSLDLVIGFYGGNYSDPVLFVPQRVYVPQHILPAVK